MEPRSGSISSHSALVSRPLASSALQAQAQPSQDEGGTTDGRHRSHPSRATEGERVQRPGKEHAADQEQLLRGEGDGRFTVRPHKNDHAHDRERMDDLVVAAGLQPFPCLRPASVERSRPCAAKAPRAGDRAAQRGDDDPAFGGSAHGAIAAVAAAGRRP